MNCVNCRLFSILSAALLTTFTWSVVADEAKPTVQTKKPAEVKNNTKKQNQPATPEAAARVLDLRTFDVMEGAKQISPPTLGMLGYEAKGTPKAAFDFQRSRLEKLGFKSLPGGYSDASNQSAHFTKDGFRVAVSTSEIMEDPTQKGWSRVSLVNSGNVALDKLPVPKGVKPFHPDAFQAAYTTDAKVAHTAAACRSLLLAAGWETYGQAGIESDESSMQYFKQNAIRLTSWVSTTPAEGGKTLIRYSTELLSVDLPVPSTIADPRYVDFQKVLNFDAPLDQKDAIVNFYQERLPRLGWEPTTERPVVDDKKKTQFLIYRNPQKELLSLDLADFTDIVRVKLKHQTAAELAEEERRFKEHAEQEKQELARKNRVIKVVVPLPARAVKLEQENGNLLEFTVATGKGAEALTMFRDHFRKAGWEAAEEAEFGENAGNLEMLKDDVQLSFSYFDTGLTPAEVRVSAPKNVVLEPQASKASPTAKDDNSTEPARPASATKPKKKSPIPGLPADIELPEEVEDIVKKALQDAEKAKPTPHKPGGPKKPAQK